MSIILIYDFPKVLFSRRLQHGVKNWVFKMQTKGFHMIMKIWKSSVRTQGKAVMNVIFKKLNFSESLLQHFKIPSGVLRYSVVKKLFSSSGKRWGESKLERWQWEGKELTDLRDIEDVGWKQND